MIFKGHPGEYAAFFFLGMAVGYVVGYVVHIFVAAYDRGEWVP